MNLLKMKTINTFLLIVLIILTGCSDGKDSIDGTEVTIIHINDHHSHLDSQPLDLVVNGKTYVMEVGEMARVASHIKALRETSKNPLVLHAGDAMSGTLYFTLFKGEADVVMMNEIGFDAFALGNHEFDEGDEVLAAFIEKANFPIISSNVEAKKGSVLDGKWQPYIIKEIDGEKIAIIGLEAAQKTSASSRPSSDITFYDEAFRVKKYVDEIHSKGINKIILLSHFGYENDQRLAQNIDGVNVIVGGDTHSLLGDFSGVGLAGVGEYPTKVLSRSGNTVCIVQAWEYSKAVGELHVKFDDKGNVTSCLGTAHLVASDHILVKDAEGKTTKAGPEAMGEIAGALNQSSAVSVVPEDPVISKKLSVYKDQIKDKAAKIIGTIGEDLRHIRVPGKTYDGTEGRELPFGSELAPVIAASFYAASLRADACIQNAGGVRSGIKAGPISIGDVYALLPFSNTLIEIELTGAQIKQLLEEALINFYDNYGSNGSFPYAYGLKYDIDMNLEKNNRVTGLEIKERTSGKWTPLDMSKKYVIVVNSYIAEGKDGYTTLAEAKRDGGEGVDTYLDYAMSFANYIESLGSKHLKVMKLLPEESCIKSYKEKAAQ